MMTTHAEAMEDGRDYVVTFQGKYTVFDTEHMQGNALIIGDKIAFMPFELAEKISLNKGAGSGAMEALDWLLKYCIGFAVQNDEVASRVETLRSYLEASGEPLAWLTRGMSAKGDWYEWVHVSEKRAEQWKRDVSFRIGRRQVIPVFAHPTQGEKS